MAMNRHWGLSPGDGKRQANSSFKVKPGQQAEVVGLGICCGDEIKIFKVYRPADCSNSDAVAIPLAPICANCDSPKDVRLTESTPRVLITEPGEYIVARPIVMLSNNKDDYDIKAQNVEVRVILTNLLAGYSYGVMGACCA
jgi:hypothetical protein